MVNQLTDPKFAAYVPTPQVAQTDAEFPENAPAWHCVHAVAPAEEYVPGTQFAQTEDIADANVPDEQTKQTCVVLC